MTAPSETPWFQHSAEFTLTLTVVVAGGTRRSTADHRAGQVFERVANHTARCKHVVAVTARGGPSHHGQVSWPQPVAFDAANTEPATFGEGKLLRYLDPEYERAQRALAAANDAAARRREADRRCRRAVGCANDHLSLLEPTSRRCGCVCCQREEHLLTFRRRQSHPKQGGLELGRCLCGQTVPYPNRRCTAHHGTQLEVLDTDALALTLLKDYLTAK